MLIDLEIVVVKSAMGPREIVKAWDSALQKCFAGQVQLATLPWVDHLDHVEPSPEAAEPQYISGSTSRLSKSLHTVGAA